MLKHKLLLVRHGVTEWNMQGRLQGQKDTELEHGWHLQNEMVEYICNQQVVNVFVSPLQRAMQTWELLSEYLSSSCVTVDQRLKEMSFGRCEGMTRAEIEAAYPSLYASREKDKVAFVWPEGESIQLLKERTRSFAEECSSALQLGTVLVIAHEMVIKSLISHWVPGSEPSIWYTRLHHNDLVSIEQAGSYLVETFAEQEQS